ncbi:hypothetical protein EJB05_06182, partial [Eragrostis curvula]
MEGVLPKDGDGSIIGPEDIAQVVSTWTAIPATRLGRDERTRLLELPERLHQCVVADTVLRSRSGLASPNRPSGSFLFLICVEYVCESSVARLIGSAP